MRSPMSFPQKKKLSVSIIIPFAILALVFGILVWKKTDDTRTLHPVAPETKESVSARSGVLFFGSSDGTTLVREGRELDSCADQNDCLSDLLEELLSGPVGNLQTVIPESSALVSATIEGETVVIDLNSSFAEDLLSGSNAEMLAVYSIVNTVALNFPTTKSVKINIAGNSKAVLRHLELAEPLQPDFTLENNRQESPQEQSKK